MVPLLVADGLLRGPAHPCIISSGGLSIENRITGCWKHSWRGWDPAFHAMEDQHRDKKRKGSRWVVERCILHPPDYLKTSFDKKKMIYEHRTRVPFIFHIYRISNTSSYKMCQCQCVNVVQKRITSEMVSAFSCLWFKFLEVGPDTISWEDSVERMTIGN